MTSQTTAPAKERHVWIDAARGLAVLAVVVFHVCLWHYWKLDNVAESRAGEAWRAIHTVVGSLRMPLLLFLSGMLASSKVRGGPKQVAVSVTANCYLYVAWLLIYGLMGWLTQPGTPHHIDGVQDLVTQLLLPDTPLWYVYGLAVYLTGLTLLRNVSPTVILLVLSLAYVVITVDMASETRFATGLWYQIPRLAVFFALGVYGRQIFLTGVPANKVSLAVCGTVAGVVLVAISRGVPLNPLAREALDMTRNMCLALAALGMICMATAWPTVAHVGQFFGRRTLGIYVLHFPLVTAVILLDRSRLHALVLQATQNDVLSAMYPLVVSAMVVTGCLVVENALRRARGDFLFTFSERWQRRIART